MKYSTSTLVALSLLALPPAAQAATIAVSDPLVTTLGLSQGDTFRMVFVTSTATNATSTNINTYNTFVTNIAKDLAGNTGSIVAQYVDWSWSVIGSTATVNAIDNTLTTWTDAAPGHPIFLVGGGSSKVADSYKDLWDGSILRTISLNEKGVAAGSGSNWRWSGTASNGSSLPSDGGQGPLGKVSSSWQTGPGAATSSTNTNWIQREGDLATSSYRLLAMSGAITVVPEPATLSMLALGGLAILRRRRK
jgi:hypothetical protein